MRTAFVKLLVAITISAMIALASMGVYIVGMQSKDNPIVVPVQKSIKRLPSQSPRPTPGKHFVPPNGYNPDSPSPK